MARRPLSRSRAGFSLTEVALSVFLLGSMTLVAGMATDRCFAMFRVRRTEQEVTASVGRTLQRLAKELGFVGLGSMSPKPVLPWDTESLTFHGCGGYDADAADIDWGPERVLRFEYELGEIDNGEDDNGNGLIDEGIVVWIENEGEADEQRIVLAHGVCEFLQGEEFNGDDDNGNGLIDEQGLSFSLAGEVLTVRLSMQAATSEGVVITKTMETSVFIRN